MTVCGFTYSKVNWKTCNKKTGNKNYTYAYELIKIQIKIQIKLYLKCFLFFFGFAKKKTKKQRKTLEMFWIGIKIVFICVTKNSWKISKPLLNANSSSKVVVLNFFFFFWPNYNRKIAHCWKSITNIEFFYVKKILFLVSTGLYFYDYFFFLLLLAVN